MGVAVSGNRVGALVVRKQEQDVWALGRRSRLGQQKAS
jgi:hypothetical protein